MTSNAFRRLALSLPETSEVGHMDHPDFRVNGKIFATFFTRDDTDWGMVKLQPNQQREFMAQRSDVFIPASGAWGRRGATLIRLSAVKPVAAKFALLTAWLNSAPKRLISKLNDDVSQ